MRPAPRDLSRRIAPSRGICEVLARLDGRRPDLEGSRRREPDDSYPPCHRVDRPPHRRAGQGRRRHGACRGRARPRRGDLYDRPRHGSRRARNSTAGRRRCAARLPAGLPVAVRDELAARPRARRRDPAGRHRPHPFALPVPCLVRRAGLRARGRALSAASARHARPVPVEAPPGAQAAARIRLPGPRDPRCRRPPLHGRGRDAARRSLCRRHQGRGRAQRARHGGIRRPAGQGRVRRTPSGTGRHQARAVLEPDQFQEGARRADPRLRQGAGGGTGPAPRDRRTRRRLQGGGRGFRAECRHRRPDRVDRDAVGCRQARRLRRLHRVRAAVVEREFRHRDRRSDGLRQARRDLRPRQHLARDRRGGAGLVSPPDVDSVAAHILLLAGDPTRAARMGAAGRRLAETRYDWARIAVDLERVYAEHARR